MLDLILVSICDDSLPHPTPPYPHHTTHYTYTHRRIHTYTPHTHTLQAGTDRTGEVSGAYYLKFLNMSFYEALNIDNHIQKRDM